MFEHSDLVCVKKVPGKGRGVFARKAIPKGTVLERVPLFLVPVRHIVDGLKNRELAHFFYLHDEHHVALPLGYGCIYNHSFQPNTRYDEAEDAELTMVYRTLRAIEPGEELCINYNWDPEDQTPMIFDVVE